jgi:hypothetical protein
MLLFTIFIVFVFFALLFKDVYVYGMASFFSIILGIQLALSFAGDSSAWAFSLVGFAFILFGLWLMVAAYKMTENKQNVKRA